MKTLKKFEAYKYYGIIGLLSLIILLFMPFVGSAVGLAFVLPNTLAGWFVYIFTKVLVVAFNLAIFYSFMEQAKINVRDNPRYIEANTILRKYFKELNPIPMAPDAWTHKQYKSKGISLAITTLLGAIALTNAILTFSVATFISYFFTVLLGIVFGFVQMGVAEEYWTGEYWEYAIYIRDQREPQETLDQNAPAV